MVLRTNVDAGLLKLLDQIDAAAPRRDRSSDGTVGDPAHMSRDSDHNPESPPPPGNPDNQIDGLDITHDPVHGADMAIISEAIRVSRDRRVSYVIYYRHITGPGHGWRWDPYTGTDPHTGHMHVSVNDVHHDETQPWSIGIGDSMTLTAADIEAVAERTKTKILSDGGIQSALARIEAMVSMRDPVPGIQPNRLAQAVLAAATAPVDVVAVSKAAHDGAQAGATDALDHVTLNSQTTTTIAAAS